MDHRAGGDIWIPASLHGREELIRDEATTVDREILERANIKCHFEISLFFFPVQYDLNG